MVEKLAPLGHGEIETLILQALVRKLVVNGVLSPDDVRALLLDAATRLDLVGSEQTPQAAHIIVEEHLAPAARATAEMARRSRRNQAECSVDVTRWLA
ncbi:MAG: hypothetical protein ACREDD_08775 [Methylocella sp.]